MPSRRFLQRHDHRSHILPRRTLVLLGLTLLTVGIILPFAVTTAQDTALRVRADNTFIASDETVIGWYGPGALPGTAPGSIGRLNNDGSVTSIADLTSTTRTVFRCGVQQRALSNNRNLTFIGDARSGQIVSLSDDAPTVAVQNIDTLACKGLKHFQIAPNGNTLGYITFPVDATLETSATGTAVVLDADDYTSIASFENATSFHLQNQSAAYIGFFNDQNGLAREAGIFLWQRDGGQPVEVATLFSREGCYYTTSAVQILSDEKIATVVSYRCPQTSTRSSWALYIVDIPSFTAVLLQEAESGGAYLLQSRNNVIFSAPDAGPDELPTNAQGEATLPMIYITVPDGFTAASVSLLRIDPNTGEMSTVIDRYAIVPRLSEQPFDGRQSVPVLSGDGRYLTMVRSTPNDESSLFVIDLLQPDVPPIQVESTSRGQVFSSVTFTQDSQALYYVLGGVRGVDNAMFQLDLASGIQQRLARGRYNYGVISPDNSRGIFLQWEQPDPARPIVWTLDGISFETRQSDKVYIGGDVSGTSVENRRYFYPLYWLSQGSG